MKNQSVIPAFDFREMVVTSDNKVITTSLHHYITTSLHHYITTSLKVAHYFGKRHKDVLRALRNLKCSEDFTRRNFAPVEFIDKNGDIQPMFNITRDGCMMLVMGFTGQTATAIKECYINAFNWMAEQLSRRNAIGEQVQHNFAIKETRSKLKGTIGSRLLNDRKNEKRLLAIEEEQIKALTTPDMVAIMQ